MAEFIDLPKNEHITDQPEREMIMSDGTETYSDFEDAQTFSKTGCNQDTSSGGEMPSESSIVELINELDEIFNSLLRQKTKLCDRKQKLEENLSNSRNEFENLVQEIYKTFSKFQESYKICHSALETVFDECQKKLNVRSVPEDIKKNYKVVLSIFKCNVASLTYILVSSKTAFEEFEYLAKFSVETSEEGIVDRVEHFTTAIEKASHAYEILRSLVFDK